MPVWSPILPEKPLYQLTQFTLPASRDGSDHNTTCNAEHARMVSTAAIGAKGTVLPISSQTSLQTLIKALVAYPILNCTPAMKNMQLVEGIYFYFFEFESSIQSLPSQQQTTSITISLETHISSILHVTRQRVHLKMRWLCYLTCLFLLGRLLYSFQGIPVQVESYWRDFFRSKVYGGSKGEQWRKLFCDFSPLSHCTLSYGTWHSTNVGLNVSKCSLHTLLASKVAHRYLVSADSTQYSGA